MLDSLAASKNPLPCPNCLKPEGVPVAVGMKTAEKFDVWIRCCRCAHEWRIQAVMAPLVLKRKPDRRQKPRSGGSTRVM
ncbi:MAG TPA: hypothetical protein VEC39_12910 [Vicinamibacterales bacterium]|nr:hypothetical protein [Vicinamibacterales bacterium]